jgi:hypothetical protein
MRKPSQVSPWAVLLKQVPQGLQAPGILALEGEEDVNSRRLLWRWA